MQIGKLNDLFPKVGFSYHFDGSARIPCADESGDPTLGQLLQFPIRALLDRELAMELELPKEAFVDRVVLRFGPKTKLNHAKVLCGEQVLFCHRAETGKSIHTPELALEVGCLCRKLTVVISSSFATFQLEGIDLYGALEDGADLFPTPKNITIGGRMIPLTAFCGAWGDSEEARQAAALLCEKINERNPSALAVQEAGNIRFVTDKSQVTDGYSLEINESGAFICASNLRGFVTGAEAFCKLAADAAVPAVTISDAPFKTFRGVHLFIPSAENMAFAKRLIKYLISPMGYNVVILQVSGGMIYERHPKISEAFAHAVQMREQGWPAFPHHGIAEGKPITKAQLKEYIAYIRSFGIDVIPEIQSLAHVQYLTHAYPEIAEIDESLRDNVDTNSEDKLPSTFYHHDYCPSNPRTYEILFDVIDEIIEVFEPKEYIHMGHDEVRSIGVCPRCKGKAPADLFTDDILKIHGYLKSKGLKMMIWADMLQPMPKYPTHPAIDRIPKDIVLLDFIWYFHLDKDIENNLLDKGFPVMIGNLYSSHFPRYESRIRQEGIHGGQISAWTATTEYDMQKEGKLYDILMTAQLLWSEDYSGHCRLVYDRMLQAQMPRLREDLQKVRYPSRIEGVKVRCWDGSPLGPVDSLKFYHSAQRLMTKEPWLDLTVVAKYIITYEDGSTEEVPVTYGGNIGYRFRRQNAPIAHPFYRHTGYTATYYCDSETAFDDQGTPLTTYIYEYLPKAKKAIRSITLEENTDFDPKVRPEKIEGYTL